MKTEHSEGKLKVGDVIYRETWGRISDTHVIDRVTPKRAFSGYNQFDIEYFENGRLRMIGAGGWSSGSYYLETDALKEQYRIQKLKLKIRDFNLIKLPVSDLENISVMIDSYIAELNKTDEV